jgi:hypothetical protein
MNSPCTLSSVLQSVLWLAHSLPSKKMQLYMYIPTYRGRSSCVFKHRVLYCIFRSFPSILIEICSRVLWPTYERDLNHHLSAVPVCLSVIVFTVLQTVICSTKFVDDTHDHLHLNPQHDIRTTYFL